MARISSITVPSSVRIVRCAPAVHDVPIKSDTQQFFIINSITTGNFDANFFTAILLSLLHHTIHS